MVCLLGYSIFPYFVVSLLNCIFDFGQKLWVKYLMAGLAFVYSLLIMSAFLYM
jgi:hypothetical protein